MPLTTAGRNWIATAIINSGPPVFFDNSHAYLGVGDSNTAFDPSQTDLQASTNKVRKAMEASYPTIATNVLTFKSSFGASDANWHWLEWALFNANSSGTMLSRDQEDMGTKSGGTWVLEAQITVAIGS